MWIIINLLLSLSYNKKTRILFYFLFKNVFITYFNVKDSYKSKQININTKSLINFLLSNVRKIYLIFSEL